MLALGQSSSAKIRGGLAADVSSGLIFLKKKKIYNNRIGKLGDIKHVCAKLLNMSLVIVATRLKKKLCVF